MPCFSSSGQKKGHVNFGKNPSAISLNMPCAFGNVAPLRKESKTTITVEPLTKLPITSPFRLPCLPYVLNKNVKIECQDLILKRKPEVPACRTIRAVQRLNPQQSKTKQTILTGNELNRLRETSRIVTVEEKLEALAKNEQETKRLELQAENIRARFREIDEARLLKIESKGEKEDLTGAGEKLKVLEKAFLAKHEQEEEVKRVNRLILNAQCSAGRDAQLLEKNKLDRQKRDEEIRIEKMVLDQAALLLEEDDQKFRDEQKAKEKYQNAIRKQLKERENLRFLEAERVEMEGRLSRKAHEAYEKEMERQKLLHKERSAAFRAELNKMLEIARVFKKMLCEQERETDRRIQAYLREKEDRERALRMEKQVAKEALDRKQHRLFVLGQKVIEAKSKREEMSFIREQERIEREYRKKELESAQRRKRIEIELRQARDNQLEEIKHRHALQIARDEQDFMKVAEELKKEQERANKQNQDRELRSKCYRGDIIRQMSDKEMERRRQLELERAQAFAWRESERQREANIRAIIDAKLKAMREACLPERYISDVRKQLNRIASAHNVHDKQSTN